MGHVLSDISENVAVNVLSALLIASGAAIGGWMLRRWQRIRSGGQAIRSQGGAQTASGGTTPLSVEQVVRVFNSVFPNKTTFDQQTYLPLLKLLHVPDDALARRQEQIRAALGAANDATYLYGSRGEAGQPLFVQRRRETCAVIAGVLNKP